MQRRALTNFIAAVLLCVAASAVARAQDFQRSYNVGPNGSISIANVSGDVNIKGYDGSAVEVSGFKEGPDRNVVEVEDLSANGRVELRAKYPRNCNCDASIRFEVRVPRSISFDFDKISTASGNVRVRLPASVDADVEMSTASGDIDTNFPVEVKDDKYGSGKHARGRLGSGSRLLRISSASGDLSLKSI